MVQKARTIISAGIIFFNLTSYLSAADFHSIDSITSNTAATDFFAVSGLINGAGVDFDADPPHDTIVVTGSSLWVTEACGFACDYYLTLPVPVLTIDLGSDKQLNEISVWGYSDSNTNGAKKASLRFATDSEGNSNFANSISFAPSFPLLNGQTLRQSFAFGRTLTARYVEVTLAENHFFPPGDGSTGGLAGGDRVGLGEIAFATPTPLGTQILASAPNDFSLKQGDLGASPLFNLLAGDNYWAVERVPGTSKILLSAPTDGQIKIIDLSDSPISESVLVNEPGAVFHGLAVNSAEGIFYAADSASDTIRKFNLSDGSTAGSIGSNFIRPNELIYDAASDRLVLSDSGLDTISVYRADGSSATNLSDATTVGAWGLAFDPQNGDLLYSSHDLGKIYRSDLSGGAATIEYENLIGPRGLGYDQHGRLYCVESGTGVIRTFDVPPFTDYLTAPGGRDLVTLDQCDLDDDFLPDAWEATSGGMQLGFFSDPENDGNIAGLEAATGGSATSNSDARPLTLIRSADGEFTLSHLALIKSPFIYQLSLSTDLATWNPAVTIPSVTAGSGLYQTHTYRFAPTDENFPANTDRLFVRLGVTTP